MKTITISDEAYKKLKDQLEKEETKIQIKTIDGKILYESNKATIKEALEEAVMADAYLVGANLTGADLAGTNLAGAELTDADFYNTKFYGKRGTAKINKEQVNNFLTALGIVVVEKGAE